MGPSGAAAVAMGLWVLVTVGVAVDPGVEAPGRCLLSQYRSLDPRALEAVKALRNRYVSDAHTPLPPGPWTTGPPGPRTTNFVPRGPLVLASSRRILDLGVQNSGHTFPAALVVSSYRALVAVTEGRPLQVDSAPRPCAGSAPGAQVHFRPASRLQRALWSGHDEHNLVGRPDPRAGVREDPQHHPGPCPAGGRDAELEAAQLLVPPEEEPSAAVAAAGPARLLEEVPAAAQEASQNSQSCEWSGRSSG
ncbi:uncharacterized protein [Vicugna pacos]|uniref:Uncharacterized protein isoform X3 n=1 Tax=Vicugna pacos TaxID=30538 RepID=A0ABM5DVF3_VICPA